MINKNEKKPVADIEIFEPRQYSNAELQNFHDKIQRFWSGNKFLHEELHVAYGIAWKEERGKKADGTPACYYFYNHDGYEQFADLWRQYERWKFNQQYVEASVPAIAVALEAVSASSFSSSIF
jgi:hypothetical protein